jgi:hypothetical protein
LLDHGVAGEQLRTLLATVANDEVNHGSYSCTENKCNHLISIVVTSANVWQESVSYNQVQGQELHNTHSGATLTARGSAAALCLFDAFNVLVRVGMNVSTWVLKLLFNHERQLNCGASNAFHERIERVLLRLKSCIEARTLIVKQTKVQQRLARLQQVC